LTVKGGGDGDQWVQWRGGGRRCGQKVAALLAVAKALAVAKMLLGVCANDKGSVVHGRSARAQVAAA
jgi:hypothetical protein